jgi:hypothetical protein
MHGFALSFPLSALQPEDRRAVRVARRIPLGLIAGIVRVNRRDSMPSFRLLCLRAAATLHISQLAWPRRMPDFKGRAVSEQQRGRHRKHSGRVMSD